MNDSLYQPYYYDDHPHHRHRDDRHLINLDNLDVDDRDQVVKEWRRLGVKCFQVEYGHF